MGCNAQATVCYGTSLKEGVEMPWGDCDIETWWVKEVCQFKPTKEIWSEEGERLEGVTEEDRGLYYKERGEVAKTLPVELVYVGHYDSMEFLVALPGSVQTSDWTPVMLKQTDISSTHENIDKLNAFTEFCDKYIPEELRAGKPGFYLSSFYG